MKWPARKGRPFALVARTDLGGASAASDGSCPRHEMKARIARSGPSTFSGLTWSWARNLPNPGRFAPTGGQCPTRRRSRARGRETFCRKWRIPDPRVAQRHGWHSAMDGTKRTRGSETCRMAAPFRCSGHWCASACRSSNHRLPMMQCARCSPCAARCSPTATRWRLSASTSDTRSVSTARCSRSTATAQRCPRLQRRR